MQALRGRAGVEEDAQVREEIGLRSPTSRATLPGRGPPQHHLQRNRWEVTACRCI